MSSTRRAYDLLRGFVNREWDRIQGIDLAQAEIELDAPSASESTNAAPPLAALPGSDLRLKACEVLGVSDGASFEDIRKSFERLNERSDPARFPEGSEERLHASQIQSRVNWAYRSLTENTSTTEKRFKSLEIG